MNKRWVKVDDELYELYFTPWCDEELWATVYFEDDGGWCYSSDQLNRAAEYLGSDNATDAMTDVDNVIAEHFDSEAKYYIELLHKWEGD